MENILSFWRRGSTRSLTYQWALVAAILLALFWLLDTANTNLDRLGITTGFAFLDDEAGFQISQALFPYSAQSTYIDALLVTFTNTIVLSLIAIILATTLGFFVALARLSNNLLLRKFGGFYVEIFRNIPLLLQLFFWYFAALKMLPSKRESINVFDIAFLNIEGFALPAPIVEDNSVYVLWAIIISILIAIVVWRWARKRQSRTGKPFPKLFVGTGIILLVPLITAWFQDFPLRWEIPVFGRFNFEGGIALQPEFTAMLFGLTLYNAAFIGEIIRAGILSVHKGQREAASSIGFTQMQVYSEVIVPQAMRLIIPPLTNQYLNLTKSTALAAALGYPDFFWALSGAIAAQTGQVLELQAITLFGYLGISLFIAAVMAVYNRATRIPER